MHQGWGKAVATGSFKTCHPERSEASAERSRGTPCLTAAPAAQAHFSATDDGNRAPSQAAEERDSYQGAPSEPALSAVEGRAVQAEHWSRLQPRSPTSPKHRANSHLSKLDSFRTRSTVSSPPAPAAHYAYYGSATGRSPVDTSPPHVPIDADRPYRHQYDSRRSTRACRRSYEYHAASSRTAAPARTGNRSCPDTASPVSGRGTPHRACIRQSPGQNRLPGHSPALR